jgi:hypothetical protein
MSLLSTKTKKKEPIKLMSRRHNYFPKRFMWRGKRYDVFTVERAWTKTKRKTTWHFFRVRCKEGTFDIFQDTKLNAWYLAAQVA